MKVTVNEVLCKVLCHNLACIVHAITEFGIDVDFSKPAQAANAAAPRELDMIATFPWPDVSMLVDDIAWAWLKLSRGRETCKTFEQIDFIGVTEEDAEQAAKYAEVLLIAAQVRINFTWLPDAHAGTREGARAAWKFIHGQMLVEAGNAWERYRRELEAM